MNAAFLTALKSSAATAQRYAGETFTIAGDATEYQGVMDEVEAVLPATNAGYSVEKQLRIVATSAQFSTAPTAATRPKITARSATWALTAVGYGPFQYTLTCVPAS